MLLSGVGVRQPQTKKASPASGLLRATASRWNRLLNPHSPRSRSHFIGTASIELPTSRYPARRGRLATSPKKEVKGLKFKDGVWRSRARGGNDQWVKIAVGPLSGKVYVTDAPSQLNKDEIKARLTTAGYEKIHDVEYEHGLWSAEADTSDGTDVDLLVDPDDGSVVARSRD